jgi:hypothetical protein
MRVAAGKRRLTAGQSGPRGTILNRRHPLAYNLAFWYLAQPWLFHGSLWPDLAGRNTGTLVSFGANGPLSGWQGTQLLGHTGALGFDGSTTYVTAGLTNIVGGGANTVFTIAAWVRPAISPPVGTRAEILTNSLAGGTSQYFLSYDTAGKIEVFYQTDTAGSIYRYGESTTAGALPATTWTHVVWVNSADSDAGQTVYVNGVAHPLTFFSVGSATVPSTGFGETVVGRNGSTDAEYWNGLIDDVRVYTRVLRASEVLALYQNSLLGFPGLLLPPARLIPVGPTAKLVLVTPAQVASSATTRALTFLTRPARVGWQASPGQLTRTMQTQPSRLALRAATASLMRTLVSPATVLAWQAATTAPRRTLLTRASQHAWQAPAAGLTRAALVQSGRLAWRAATSQLAGVLRIRATQMAFQVSMPSLTRILASQPARGVLAAVAVTLTRTVQTHPGRVAARAAVPLPGYSLLTAPSQMAYRATVPTLGRIVRVQPGVHAWQAGVVVLGGAAVTTVVTSLPAAMAWQTAAAEAGLRATVSRRATPVVLSLQTLAGPQILVVTRRAPVVELETG